MGAPAVAVQLPLGQEAELQGVIDLVAMKANRFTDDKLGAEWIVEEIPDGTPGATPTRPAPRCSKRLPRSMTSLMERYLEGDTDFSEDEISGHFARAASSRPSCRFSRAPPSRTRAFSS